jgi:hypothetical protein
MAARGPHGAEERQCIHVGHVLIDQHHVAPAQGNALGGKRSAAF